MLNTNSFPIINAQSTTRCRASVVVLAVLLLILATSDAFSQENSAAKSAPVEPTKTTTTQVAPAPRTVPLIAPEYEAPQTPLPPLDRVGVDAGDPLALSLNDAIRMALENNNDITASRIEVEMAEHKLTSARGSYDPQLASESYFEHSSTPINSFFGGSNKGSLTAQDFTNSFMLEGLTPKFGGKYQFNFSSSRVSSNNYFNGLDPAITSQFSFNYTQPLVRGRRTDDNRRRIAIAKKNLTLTDVQFRQRATDVITRVEQAYWELVYALRNFQVQTDAVKQARAQVETNQRQVKQGMLAPIDVVEAEAQVKLFEQNLYAAQEDVTRSENALKTLMLPERSADLWSRALLPVTPVTLEAPRLLLADAINAALDNRFELAELTTSAEINGINTRYYKDQTKPQVDLTLGYTSNGLAGTANDINNNPLVANLSSLEQRVADLSTLAGLPPISAAAFGAVPTDLRGSYGQSLGNMLRQSDPTVRVGVRISLPLRNRTAKGDLGYSLAEKRRIDSDRARTEQMIEADVRNTMQTVRSVEARLSAAAASRLATEQQYTSEQRKFQSGMSTLYLVLQRQTDLIIARGRELQTQTDLNKAIADLQRAMGNTFRYRSVAVIAEGHKFQQAAEGEQEYAPGGGSR